MFIDQPTLANALQKLYGTAGQFLKIWFTLKHMGLSVDAPPVEIDTSNSTPSLKRLFSFGEPQGDFYVPFAHTPRYLTMKHDAARSIIQTNVQRWATSGSVVTCDPTEFLDFTVGEGIRLQVAPGRRYPLGLGIGESGFAREDGTRVSVPLRSFAVWYGRTTLITDKVDAAAFLIADMLHDLHISAVEKEVIFVEDDLTVATQSTKLTDEQIFSVCKPFINKKHEPITEIYHEDFTTYARRVRSMVSALDLPAWMRTAPEHEVRELLIGGAKAILLYGPPRTGKTRLIDTIVQRDAANRCTIQIHDGWGYDHLVEGFRPDDNGNWGWHNGPLKEAIETGKKFIVLEEINRTAISQALGEVFSLIEDAYRGETNGILLRSGSRFWIPDDVVFFMTMNTIDKSTEDVDDALLGRVAAVEFPPRPEDLNQMMASHGIPQSTRENIAQIFSEIQTVYPLGHGYFSGLSGNVDNSHVIRYYKARVRPVLINFLGELKRQELSKIDNLIDEMFSST